MDVSLLIRQRLNDLGLEQKDLATSAQVTESYISQLLARKKVPPAPGRTDIYDKLERALGLAGGELSRLAEMQRRDEIRRKVGEAPGPLFQECRALILRKCEPATQKEVRTIFDQAPFGELERLVTHKLLDVAQAVAREELRSEEWLRLMAELSGRSYEQARVAILEFLDTDIFNVSRDNCVAFLDPIIEAWDIDLKTFALKVVLNERLADEREKRFEFAERESGRTEPGLERFLTDPSLSGDATEEEILFLKGLKFRGRNPSPIYFYRELQSLRDPLHFTTSGS
jgi:transcriptional regulator with XRE-family HTH domain